MKLAPFLLLPLIGSAQAVVVTVWSENFENFDTNKVAVEDQTNGDWYTSPVLSDTIAAVATLGDFPAQFGTKVLVVGGLTPVYDNGVGGVDEGADTDVTYTVSSAACYNAPTVENPISRLTTELFFSPGLGASMVDSFRFSFVDGEGDALTNLLFAPSATQAGQVSIFRYNNVNVIDTGATIPVGVGARLELLFDTTINKWSASISGLDGLNGFVVFANVDANVNPDPNLGNDFGSFSIDWLRNTSNAGWGDNYLAVDNITLESVPEPGTLALLGLSPLLFARRRRSKAGA